MDDASRDLPCAGGELSFNPLYTAKPTGVQGCKKVANPNSGHTHRQTDFVGLKKKGRLGIPPKL